MSRFILLNQKNVSNQEKEQAFESNQPSAHISIYPSEEDFINNHLIPCVQNNEFPERHEFVSHEYHEGFCFFFDLDISSTSFGNREDLQTDIVKLSANFVTFMFPRFNWVYVQDIPGQERQIMSMVDQDNFLLTFIKAMNPAVSTDNRCPRYHIIFKTVFIPFEHLNTFKAYCLEWQQQLLKTKSLAPELRIVKDVDFLMKKSFQLRYIFSEKTSDTQQESHHYVPKRCEDFVITDKDVEMTCENLKNYSISVKPVSYLTIDSVVYNDTDEKEFFNLSLNKIETENPYLYSCSIETILRTAFNVGYVSFNEANNHLIWITPDVEVNSTLISVVSRGEQIIEFKFDYDVSPCEFCGKKIHKNSFQILLGNLGFMIKKKQGNSCFIRRAKKRGGTYTYDYPPLTITNIINFFVAAGHIKKNQRGDLILFTKHHGWLEQDIVANLLNKIATEIRYPLIHQQHQLLLTKSQPVTNRAELEKLVANNTIEKVPVDPFKIRVKNGILDLATKKMIPQEDWKRFVVTNQPLEGNYVPRDEWTSDMERSYQALMDFLDSSLPHVFSDGVENKDRRLFDDIIGVLLLRLYKRLIIFLRGETGCGKSSLIRIISTMLGTKNYAKASNEGLKHSSGAHSPNPEKASIDKAFLYHMTESDGQLASDAIKDITERDVSARGLFVNKPVCENLSLIVVDTNRKEFTDIDTASATRILLIQFMITHGALKLEAEYKLPADGNLAARIDSGFYNDAILFYLVEQAQRHLTPAGMKIKTSPEYFPSIALSEVSATFFLSSLTYLTIFKGDLTNLQHNIKNYRNYESVIATHNQRSYEFIKLRSDVHIRYFKEILLFKNRPDLQDVAEMHFRKSPAAYIFFNDLTPSCQKLIIDMKNGDITNHLTIEIDPVMCSEFEKFSARMKETKSVRTDPKLNLPLHLQKLLGLYEEKFATHTMDPGSSLVPTSSGSVQHGQVSPHVSHGQVSPHVSHGQVSPHVSHGQVSPHVSHGQVSISSGQVSPHVSHGQVSISSGQVSPHVSHGQSCLSSGQVSPHVSHGQSNLSSGQTSGSVQHGQASGFVSTESLGQGPVPLAYDEAYESGLLYPVKVEEISGTYNPSDVPCEDLDVRLRKKHKKRRNKKAIDLVDISHI